MEVAEVIKHRNELSGKIRSYLATNFAHFREETGINVRSMSVYIIPHEPFGGDDPDAYLVTKVHLELDI